MSNNKEQFLLFKERFKKRRNLIVQQLGIKNANDLGQALGRTSRKPLAHSETETKSNEETEHEKNVYKKPKLNSETEKDEHAEEVGRYTDSSAFLKGLQSANPHNDYCQHFVDTGQRPQNFIRDVGLADRFEEYPKQKELIRLKDDLIAKTATPPMYLKADLENFSFQTLNHKFDVILVEPVLEEYQKWYTGPPNTKFWSWDEIMKLDLEEVGDVRSFIFLWCGSTDGLELGRQCLKKWGFRRCEDFCWIKTNIKNPSRSKTLESKAIFQRTKEHCLMGIKGTVRRSLDGDFIHANIDIDLIISEQPDFGSLEKPEEMFHIIEHFCLGRRRLHVFGRDSTIRPGWLTVGPELTNSNFNSENFNNYFNKSQSDCLTGCTERIESLRPKTPPLINNSRGGNSNRGRGRGRGR